MIAIASPASAGDAADHAAAEALFQEGKRLAAAGDFEHACPKFAESQRLDAGAGTLLNLGDCYEKIGKIASAWGAFTDAELTARNAGDTARRTEAARRAEALAPRLSRIAIVVPPTTRVPGIEIRRDGAIVGEGQWGSALPVDPGQHTIEVMAPGRKPWSTVMRVDAPGAVAKVEIPPLDPGTGEAGAATWSAQRTIGLVIGAAGLVGIGVGSAFTVKMVSKNNDSLAYCPTDPTKCYAQGVDLRNQAFDAAHIATGTFVAGAALLAGGVVVFFTAPGGAQRRGDAPAARASVVPIAGPGLAGLAVQGVW
jgi:serine/threonine-protein kinase